MVTMKQRLLAQAARRRAYGLAARPATAVAFPGLLRPLVRALRAAWRPW